MTTPFVELWPPGLRAHGGIEAFVETATQFFGGLIPKRELVDHGDSAEPRSIEELGAVLAELGERHTDALLLPHSHSG